MKMLFRSPEHAIRLTEELKRLRDLVEDPTGEYTPVDVKCLLEDSLRHWVQCWGRSCTGCGGFSCSESVACHIGDELINPLWNIALRAGR